MAKPKVGSRLNQGKLRWRNFPMFLIKPLVQVAANGEGKYETFNFLKGMYANDLLDCIKRHLEKLESPYEPDLDEESKVNHGAHIAWNALVLAYMLTFRPDLDDRFKGHHNGKKSPSSSTTNRKVQRVTPRSKNTRKSNKRK